MLNNQALGLNQDNIVHANDLAQLTYQSGSGTDTLCVRAYEGGQWGAWSQGFAVNSSTTVGAGQTLELASAFSGTITFAGSTGTLKIDAASTFSGKIGGQLAIGDVIDLADVTAGASAIIGYTGSNSPGTLTVGDGSHTASIALLGNYSLGNFTPSSDGHHGTNVVDPPLPSSPAQGATVSIVSAATAAVPASDAKAGYAVVTPVTEITIASPTQDAAPASAGVGSSIGDAVEGSAKPADNAGAMLAQAELPQSAIAREIVSPDDLILAIRTGDIAIKTDSGTGSQHAPWLFDAEEGTFEAPSAERFTVWLAGDDETDPLATVGDGAPAANAVDQTVVVPDASWLAVFRKIWSQPGRTLWWR